MGGTTAKVCLISDGEPERARRFEVGRVYRNLKGSGLPVRIPVIEMVEIGAGGGSIARVDALRRITVGPDSAGAEPGPACYGRGGEAPTVTDANLVLGRIDAEPLRRRPDARSTSRVRAHALERARRRARCGMDAFWSAAGVSEIVEENMANAARVHAIERGKVIRDYTMIAFGGAAPLHAGRLAQKLGISRVLVPAGAGVGSAIGFLRAPISYEVVRSDHRPLSQCEPASSTSGCRRCARRRWRWSDAARAGGWPAARRKREGGADERCSASRCASPSCATSARATSCRSRCPPGPLDRPRCADLAERFEAEYERVYGVRNAQSPVEVVTWLLTLSTDRRAGRHRRRSKPAPARRRRDRHAPGLGARRSAVPSPFGLHWRFDLERRERARRAGPHRRARDHDRGSGRLVRAHRFVGPPGHCRPIRNERLRRTR